MVSIVTIILLNLLNLSIILPSNSYSKRPLFHLQYEMDQLDVLLEFDFRIAVEFEGISAVYDTEVFFGEDKYVVNYIVYATSKQE